MEVHSCEECPYKSKSLFGMVYHVRHHRLNSQGEMFSCEKPPELYSCPHCYFENDLSIVLKEHVISLHKNEETEEVEDYNISTYDCESCKFQTFSVLIMLKHVTDGCRETTEPSTIQKKRFQCDQCQFSTNHKNYIKRHKIHKHTDAEDIRWLECDKCRLEFKTAELLRQHVIGYHQIQWHQCAQCPYKTVNKGDLRKHKYNKHSDPSEIKWFQCDKCSFKSKHKSSLKGHVTRMHSECVKTAEVARRSYEWEELLRMHDMEEMIEWHGCDQCQFKSISKACLRKHMLSKHSEVKNEDTRINMSVN